MDNAANGWRNNDKNATQRTQAVCAPQYNFDQIQQADAHGRALPLAPCPDSHIPHSEFHKSLGFQS